VVRFQRPGNVAANKCPLPVCSTQKDHFSVAFCSYMKVVFHFHRGRNWEREESAWLVLQLHDELMYEVIATAHYQAQDRPGISDGLPTGDN